MIRERARRRRERLRARLRMQPLPLGSAEDADQPLRLRLVGLEVLPWIVAGGCRISQVKFSSLGGERIFTAYGAGPWSCAVRVSCGTVFPVRSTVYVFRQSDGNPCARRCVPDLAHCVCSGSHFTTSTPGRCVKTMKYAVPGDQMLAVRSGGRAT